MKIGEMIYFRVVMIGNIIGITKRLEGGGRAAGQPGAAEEKVPVECRAANDPSVFTIMEKAWLNAPTT